MHDHAGGFVENLAPRAAAHRLRAALTAMPQIVSRTPSAAAVATLMSAGVPPLLARLYAARGIHGAGDLATELASLLQPQCMKGLAHATRLLADAIGAQRRLVIIADYDSDGATACAVCLRALRAFGADVDYLVPNRFEYGYGLTPEIVRLAHATKHPDILITVDNGIASCDGVAEAARLGIGVVITDHHLPGAELPQALAIVNPNQPGCEFPSKHLAGVGVAFYLMLQLRAELRARGAFHAIPEPNLAQLLDLVALGTVADVVRLDANNRLLVSQGLTRIRRGRVQPGIRQLFRVAGRDPARAASHDLGFFLGPRLNAAGRLDDMSLGIECLTTDDEDRAAAIAAQLDALNRERRAIESGMQQDALLAIERMQCADSYSVSLFDPGWHQGVIGILASRLKDKFHRPAFAFAPGNPGELKGSGRSIPGLHLRDALDLVAKREPGMILRFGGHAAAAGLTLRAADHPRFAAAFEAAAHTLLTPADLERTIETDGPLTDDDMTVTAAELLEAAVWGQGFPPPAFDNEFDILQQRIVGERHLKLRLRADGGAGPLDGIRFAHTEPLPARVHAVYRLAVNRFNGGPRLDLIVDHWEPV
jgi:single-stranded-DNA-specific exonuclease